MKAQTSLLMKGIYLIVVFVAISIALNRVVSLNLASTEEEKNFQQRDKATSLLETLAGSSECLAYEEEGSVEGTTLNLSLHRILDKRKLDDFSSRFFDIQPDCSRDFIFGYRVDVETFPFEMSSSKVRGNEELLTVTIPPMFWSFGDLEFSEKEALKESISVSAPIVVFINETTFVPGKMTVTMVGGELEELRGFVDKSCLTGINFQESFTFHYPVSFEKTNLAYSVCLEINNKKICQKLACKKTIDFPGILSSGHYIIYSKNEDALLKVIV